MAFHTVFDNECGMLSEPIVSSVLGNAYEVVKFVAGKMDELQAIAVNIAPLLATTASLAQAQQVVAMRTEVEALYNNLTPLVALYPNLPELLALQANTAQLLSLLAQTIAARDTAIAVLPKFQSVAPANPVQGQHWTDINDGKTYEYMVDAGSGQWVETGYVATAGAEAALIVEQSTAQATADATIAAVTAGVAAASNLRNDLANRSDPAKGAELVGFSGRSAADKFRDFVNALDHASISAAFAASKTVFITTPNYPVIANFTIPKDCELVFTATGSISVSTGVTLTCLGVVTGPMVWLFRGDGAVVGISQVHPEWFGAVGTGSVSDSLPLRKSMLCVAASAGSAGKKPTIYLHSPQYGITEPVKFEPTANINLCVSGAGSVLGSRFKALAGFVGTMAVHIAGQSNATVARIADYSIGGFSVVKDPAANCAVGVWVGGDSTDFNLLGFKTSLIENIYVEEFNVCWQFNQVRLATVRRCAGWAESVAGGVGVKFTVNDPLLFTGDLDFENCQFVSTPGAGGANIQFTHDGTGQIKGIRFKSVTMYKANIAVSVTATGGAQIGDIWFDSGCQFDGYFNNIFDFTIGGLSTVVNDWHVHNSYIRGVNNGGNILTVNQTAGDFSGLFFTSNWVADGNSQSRPLFEMHGTMADIHICHNTFEEFSSTNALAVFYDAATVLDVSHNSFRKRISGSMANWVLFGSMADRYVAVGNKSSGGSLTGSAIVELNGAATKYVPAGSNF